nr:glycine-rich cell wall structural protein 1.0-like [Aegilops tauschii subsp. strangulata]
MAPGRRGGGRDGSRRWCRSGAARTGAGHGALDAARGRGHSRRTGAGISGRRVRAAWGSGRATTGQGRGRDRAWARGAGQRQRALGAAWTAIAGPSGGAMGVATRRAYAGASLAVAARQVRGAGRGKGEAVGLTSDGGKRGRRGSRRPVGDEVEVDVRRRWVK